MIFVSAGHNSQSKTITPDPGAVNKDGVKEGDLTIEFRNLVLRQLDLQGIKYITDSDEESLRMYLHRIQTGPGSVVTEFHFDYQSDPKATGCTALVADDADRLDKAFAKEMVDTTASILGIYNKGVEPESMSFRKRLGLMRESGLVCLLEICYISNPTDLSKYYLKRDELAKNLAPILKKYEDMIP